MGLGALLQCIANGYRFSSIQKIIKKVNLSVVKVVKDIR